MYLQCFCGKYFIDLRDEQSHSTIQIGTHCWMAENLNIGTRIDCINNPSDNDTIEKYCYNNEPESCNIYVGTHPIQWLITKAILPAFRVVTGVIAVARSATLAMARTFGLCQRSVWYARVVGIKELLTINTSN